MSDVTKPIFRSEDGWFAVYPCKCQCDGFVRVTPGMEWDAKYQPYFYIRGHQAIGTTYERIGERYEFRAQEPQDDLPRLGVSVAPENSTTGLAGALENELEPYPSFADSDDDEKTPTVHFWLKDDHD